MTTTDVWQALARLIDAERGSDDDHERAGRCLDLMEMLVDAGQLGRLVEQYHSTTCLEAQRALSFLMAVTASTRPDRALRADLLTVIEGLPGSDPTALTNLSTAALRLAIADLWHDIDDAACVRLGHLVTRALAAGLMPATAALELLGRLFEDGIFARIPTPTRRAIVEQLAIWRARADPTIDLSLETLSLPDSSDASPQTPEASR